MASQRESRSDWYGRLGPVAHLPRTADELSRISREISIIRNSPDEGGKLRSSGWLRLFGSGIRGNVAALAAAGEAMILTQKMVTAVGASLEGQKAIHGRFSADILARTKLGLIASPMPGSVMLRMSPEMNQYDDLYPGGETPLFDNSQATLADRSLNRLVSLILLAVDRQKDADSLVASLNDLGPRVASCIDAFARCLSGHHFDAELAWAAPGSPVNRATIDAQSAKRLHNVVQGEQLDAEDVTLVGRLHTISDLTKWTLEVQGSELISVRADRLPSEDVYGFRLGQLVRIRALLTQRVRPGGTHSYDYVALGVASAEKRPANDG